MAKIFFNASNARLEMSKVFESAFPEIKNEESKPFLIVYSSDYFLWVWITKRLIITWNGDKKFRIERRDQGFRYNFVAAMPETTGYLGPYKTRVIDFNNIEVDDRPVEDREECNFYNEPY